MPSDIAVLEDCLRVLLVEDESVIAELFAESLSAEGYSVEVAGDGEQALTLFEEAEANGHPYDVVVTDVRMPRMDGVTLAHRLRDHNPGLPLVVVSGYAPDDQLQRLVADRDGPLTILAKPVRLSRLQSAVRSAIRH